MDDRILRAGDVIVMPLPDGAYGACQVTGVTKDALAVCALRWHSADPPTLDALAAAGPLALDHHDHPGQAQPVTIARRSPPAPDFVRIGNRGVPADVPAPSLSDADWYSIARQVANQYRWDHELPDAARKAYCAAAARGPVEVDFGAGPVAVDAVGHRLDLTTLVPASGPVRWTALEELPRCTTVVWSGPDRGLCAALADRPIVTSVSWHDVPAAVDLAGTAVTEAVLAGAGLRDVRLPSSLHRLELAVPDTVPAVVAADSGRRIHLTLDSAGTDAVTPPAGLRKVRNLTVRAGGTVYLGALASLTDLRTLAVHWRRPPGVLTGADTLDQVAVLTLVDGYGLTPDALPGPDSLSYLGGTGLRRSIVPALRTRYRGGRARLVLAGIRSDTWLAANLTNPFRDWVDDHAQGGTAACRAYAQAVRALDGLPASTGPGHLAAAERILGVLVERLNAIDAKYRLVDTLRREEAAEAFFALAARAGIAESVADRWFEDRRRF